MSSCRRGQCWLCSLDRGEDPHHIPVDTHLLHTAKGSSWFVISPHGTRHTWQREPDSCLGEYLAHSRQLKFRLHLQWPISPRGRYLVEAARLIHVLYHDVWFLNPRHAQRLCEPRPPKSAWRHQQRPNAMAVICHVRAGAGSSLNLRALGHSGLLPGSSQFYAKLGPHETASFDFAPTTELSTLDGTSEDCMSLRSGYAALPSGHASPASWRGSSKSRFRACQSLQTAVAQRPSSISPSWHWQF